MIMKAVQYSHRNGSIVIPGSIIDEVISSLGESDYLIERYTIGKLRSDFMLGIKKRGWSDNILLDVESKISITSEKLDIGLCLQTGNVSRTYADILKLQTLFLQDKIKAGIIIVPTSDCARKYASNSASFERLVRELGIFTQVITMPIIVVGFYN